VTEIDAATKSGEDTGGLEAECHFCGQCVTHPVRRCANRIAKQHFSTLIAAPGDPLIACVDAQVYVTGRS
jgi:hypothetical protein